MWLWELCVCDETQCVAQEEAEDVGVGVARDEGAHLARGERAVRREHALHRDGPAAETWWVAISPAVSRSSFSPGPCSRKKFSASIG